MADVASSPSQMEQHWRRHHGRLVGEVAEKDRLIEELRAQIADLRKRESAARPQSV